MEPFLIPSKVSSMDRDNGSLPAQLNAGKVLELDLSSSKMPVSPSSVKGSNLAASARLLGAYRRHKIQTSLIFFSSGGA